MSAAGLDPTFYQTLRPTRPFGAPPLTWLFLAYALPAILFLAIAMPPFQVTDEDSHALRADQVSRGTLVPPRIGGDVDGALVAFRDLFADLRFHYDRKITAETVQAAASLRWTAPDRDANFQNTAQYGPLLYLPQVVGIWTGKLLGFNLVWTILCARLVNGLVATFVGLVSICICRRGQAMVFTTLLLPMTMSEFASASQDALVIGLSIFAGALASRIITERRSARTWEFLLFVAIVVATTMARPSQLALAGLGIAFLGWPEVFWRGKLGIALIGLAAVGWWLITLLHLMPEPGEGGSLYGQLVAIARDPGSFSLVLYRSLRGQASWLFQTLVGIPGWLDTPLPHWYYIAAAGALISAWFAPGNTRPYALPAFVGMLTFGVMLLAVSLALYASWTPVGKSTIDGLQGRYMLPVLPLLAWAAPAYRSDIQRLLFPTWIVVAVFPLISLSVLPEAIMMRYYGSWSAMGLFLKALYAI